MPQADEIEKNLIDVRTKLGLYYAQMAQPDKAKAVIDPIVALATERNYKRRVSKINCIMGLYASMAEEDLTEGFKYYQNSIKIGTEINDPISLVLANIFMGANLSEECEFARALSCLEKALEINVASNVLWGISATKSWIAWLVPHKQGNIDFGYATSYEALRIADESGDIYSKAHAYTAHGWSYYHKGYLKEAKEHLLKGADFSERINLVYWVGIAHFGLAVTYFDREEYKISQKHYESSISHYRQGRLWPSWVNFYKIALALAKVMSNEEDINLNEIYKCYSENNSKLYEGPMQSCIGEILLNLNDQHISEAEDWIKKAIEADKSNGMKWHLAKDYARYAELFKQREDLPKVRENLSKAIEIFKECGADGWVEKYEKELSAL